MSEGPGDNNQARGLLDLKQIESIGQDGLH